MATPRQAQGQGQRLQPELIKVGDLEVWPYYHQFMPQGWWDTLEQQQPLDDCTALPFVAFDWLIWVFRNEWDQGRHLTGMFRGLRRAVIFTYLAKKHDGNPNVYVAFDFFGPPTVYHTGDPEVLRAAHPFFEAARDRLVQESSENIWARIGADDASAHRGLFAH